MIKSYKKSSFKVRTKFYFIIIILQIYISDNSKANIEHVESVLKLLDYKKRSGLRFCLIFSIDKVRLGAIFWLKKLLSLCDAHFLLVKILTTGTDHKFISS